MALGDRSHGNGGFKVALGCRYPCNGGLKVRNDVFYKRNNDNACESNMAREMRCFTPETALGGRE